MEVFSLLEYPIVKESPKIRFSLEEDLKREDLLEISFKSKDVIIGQNNLSINSFLLDSADVYYSYNLKVVIKHFDLAKSKVLIQIKQNMYDVLRYKGTSLVYLVLEDYGFVSDYGGTGRDRDFTFRDHGFHKGYIYLDKWNYISWGKKPIKHPFITLLYYGKLIYFYNLLEFNEFNSEFFKARENDICPVCGGFKGRHLRYVFIEPSKIPQHYYVCSKSCLRQFTGNRYNYIKLLQNKQQV